MLFLSDNICPVWAVISSRCYRTVDCGICDWCKVELSYPCSNVDLLGNLFLVFSNGSGVIESYFDTRGITTLFLSFDNVTSDQSLSHMFFISAKKLHYLENGITNLFCTRFQPIPSTSYVFLGLIPIAGLPLQEKIVSPPHFVVVHFRPPYCQ